MTCDNPLFTHQDYNESLQFFHFYSPFISILKIKISDESCEKYRVEDVLIHRENTLA